jgi:hypothetical protein
MTAARLVGLRCGPARGYVALILRCVVLVLLPVALVPRLVAVVPRQALEVKRSGAPSWRRVVLG